MNRKKIKLLSPFCCSLLAIYFLTGCQLPLANYLRDNTFPQDTGTKIALSPVLFPTYAVASVCDVTIINPIRGTKNVPSVVEKIWKWEDETLWIGKGVLLPVKFVGIPPASLGTILFSEQFIYIDSKPIAPPQK